jgi:hypothetical protein
MADTFTCEWLNRIDQMDATDITLIVTHDQGVIPSQRFERNYHVELDAAKMEDEAAAAVEQVVAEWNAEQAAKEAEVQP